MLNIIISHKLTNKLFGKLLIAGETYSFISFRDLSKSEIATARKYNVQRHLLTSLNAERVKDFFCELDTFWDNLITPFDKHHPFWRNVFSTKMQEWEKSPVYLILVLYSLLNSGSPGSPGHQEKSKLIIICNSIEESIVCQQWGGFHGWEVLDNYFGSYPKFIVRTLQESKNSFNFLIVALKLIVKKIFSSKADLDTNTKKSKVLISTLFYENCFVNGQYTDHFFGELEQLLKKNDYETEYLAAPLGNYFKTVNKARKRKSFYIPYSMISWLDVARILGSLLKKKKYIKKAIFKKTDFSALIKWSMRRNISFFNCDAEVFYLAVKKLCKNKSYDKLIQLYEGNITEKASIQAFKKFNRGKKILGYSFAVVYPLNLKIHRTSKESSCAPCPDLLVTSGMETKKLLSNCGDYENINILSGCSLREFPNINVSETLEDGADNTILIALDGTWSSVSFLDWILLNFKQLKDNYKIVLRGHPSVPVEGLLSQCVNNKLPSNFQISSGTLEDDLSRCFCVIYRQSSVGLQALMSAIPVIQLNIDSPLNGDPIENLHDCKWVVDNMDDLNISLKKITSLQIDEKKSGMIKAKQYSAKYFTPPDHETLNSFLN